jgi:hypothetical protein
VDSAKPIPILLMIRQTDYGGTELQLTELAKAIDRSKFLTHVGSLHGGVVRSQELRVTLSSQ